MEMYGEKVRLVPFGQKRSLLQRLGMAATDGLMQGVEERALWARFGL
jgi:serine protease SohB